MNPKITALIKNVREAIANESAKALLTHNVMPEHLRLIEPADRPKNNTELSSLAYTIKTDSSSLFFNTASR